MRFTSSLWLLVLLIGCKQATSEKKSLLSKDNQTCGPEANLEVKTTSNVLQIFEIAQICIEEYLNQFNARYNSIDERVSAAIYSIYHRGLLDRNFFVFNSGDAHQDEQNELLVAGPKVDDARCGKHLNAMIRLMEEMQVVLEKKRSAKGHPKHTPRLDEKYLRLARALESYGRYDSGYLSGKTHSFGSYTQCVTNKLDLGEANLVKNRFCWAKLRLDKHLMAPFKVSGQNYPLSVAICLPETCHTRSFKLYSKQIQKLVDSEFSLPQSFFVHKNLEVESIFCTVDEDSELRVPMNGRILLGLMVAWLVLLLWATIRRQQVTAAGAEWPRGLSCLDLKASWQEFVCAKSADQPARRRVDLDTLNPVRCAGCAFVVWGHAVIVRTAYSMDQSVLPSQYETEAFKAVGVPGTLIVDTFFAMTGLIMTYLIMKKASRGRPEQPPEGQSKMKNSLGKFLYSFYVIVKSRYLKLLPLLVLFYWFKRSVFIYLGSGPFWDFGFNRDTYNGACHQESWLVPFTFTSAFLPLSKQCLMQSWSVSNDMFFVVLFTPIMLIMTRRPKLAALLAVVYCVASLQALLNAIRALDPGHRLPLEEMNSQGVGAMFSHVSHIYSNPTYRVSSFAVGMMAGWFLHQYNECRINQWPRWFTGPATSFSVVYIAGLFLVLSNGGLIKPYISPHHRILFPYFMTLGKTIWAATNCVVFLRMMTDWNSNFWMRASAGKFWQSMSKINYAILLLHFDLLIYDMNATTQGNLASMWSIFASFANVYLICLVLAVAVFVALENPLDKLIRQFMFAAETRSGQTGSDKKQLVD